MAIGFTLPFSKSTGSIGFFQTTETDLHATEQNLRSLLLTNWGERVNHYNFGCNLKEFLFENITSDELKAKMADRILGQTDSWLPYVSVTDLYILTTEDDSTIRENTVKVKIKFNLKSRPDFKSKLDLLISQ